MVTAAHGKGETNLSDASIVPPPTTTRPEKIETKRPPIPSANILGPGAGAQLHIPKPMTRWLLFSTGFISMAMEVVWVRAFAPVLKTEV